MLKKPPNWEAFLLLGATNSTLYRGNGLAAREGGGAFDELIDIRLARGTDGFTVELYGVLGVIRLGNLNGVGVAAGRVADREFHDFAAGALGCALILDSVEVLEEGAEVAFGQILSVIAGGHGGNFLLGAVLVGRGFGGGADFEGVGSVTRLELDLADRFDLDLGDGLGRQRLEAGISPAYRSELDGVDDVFVGVIDEHQTIVIGSGGVQGDVGIGIRRFDGRVRLAQTVALKLFFARVNPI